MKNIRTAKIKEMVAKTIDQMLTEQDIIELLEQLADQLSKRNDLVADDFSAKTNFYVRAALEHAKDLKEKFL